VEGGRWRIEYSPYSVTMQGVSLGDCVKWSYRVEEYQLSVAGSLERTSYDIRAKAAGPVRVSELRIMMQHLLEQRFKLGLHRESKMLPVYALTVAKGGPRLPAANPEDGHHAVETLPQVLDRESFFFRDSSMAEFAAKLSMLRGIDRPVVDQTGIEGFFDITLKGAARAILQPDGPSLFTLIPEQLGLKLVATKAPVEMLIIDRTEKPVGN
jgi:uncharacterized protein (TIGR03435 family)